MKINKLIDHTLLRADALPKDIVKLCEEAKEYDFMSVCVNPGYVSLAALELAGTDVEVCTVIGFPLGATSIESKALEAAIAVEEGAAEVDMVINVGKLKAGLDLDVYTDIRAVKNAVGEHIILKVIIETALLTDEEKVRASVLAKKAGADFVKTSTGFSTGGATVADVKLMREAVGPNVGVKASGGVRTLSDLEAMVKAGANRIGTSNGIAFFKGEEGKGY
ncbi:MAG TPA: deoxyribose-phosphate aldolase [Bacilli bacterium]|nr:deoxyribose-phosphate aldolase [Bacilli bacterium]